MNDLTRGPVRRHLVRQALPIAIGMLVQTLYLLVDLYFVGRLGGAALAGVGAAGNLMFMVMALTQMLSVGMVALIAPALGRGDTAEARLLFNQGLSLAALGSLITLATGYAFASSYLQLLGADHATRREGLAYLYAYLPGLALQFPLAALGAALRASGMTKPGMLVQLLTVLINTVLAPILITGAGTGLAMGVAGAGLASSVAIAAGALIVARYIFALLGGHLRPERKAMRPQWPVWKTILGIGFPAGAEFACIFLLAALTYHALSRFGADAMAGFGIGTRIMQAIFLPGMAIAFAIPAIAGQNLGAGRLDRVGETMREALKLECGVMVMLTVLCKWQGGAFVGTFTSGAGAASVAREYLDVI
jgi:putative MATE family efflux protein